MQPALSVLEFELTGYRRTWRGSVLSSFVLPVLFVIGFGFSVGTYVDAGHKLGPVSYLDYIVPGMLASTAMQVAFGESAWPVMGRFQWFRLYHAMIAAPLRVVDILAGDLLFVLFRIVTTSSVFLLVISVLGAVRPAWSGVHSWWALATIPICGLVGMAFAAPIFAYAGLVQTDSYFPLLQRFVVLPMSLFAGVFFPVERLPEALRWLAYVSPLWHAVELCRAATLPAYRLSWLAVAGHVGYLAGWIAAGFWLAAYAFRRRVVV
jgi:lipooligosaccharide transport system permease protein